MNNNRDPWASAGDDWADIAERAGEKPGVGAPVLALGLAALSGAVAMLIVVVLVEALA